MLNLGYTDTELFMALSWVRELAPLIVHINLDKALGVVLAKGQSDMIERLWFKFANSCSSSLADSHGAAAHWQVGQFFMKDTHYRNQFETKTSGGLLKTSAREKWERGTALRHLCCMEACCRAILVSCLLNKAFCLNLRTLRHSL